MDPIRFEELDQAVCDYLSFRSYLTSLDSLENERRRLGQRGTVEGTNGINGSNSEEIIENIMKSFSEGDYPRVLTLWDAYVVQSLRDRSAQIGAEARVAEFYINLQCATFPFRNNVLREVGAPNVAAKLAARSMTIFRSYIESRGKSILQNQEFQVYKNLHKIAFPPTHPSFSHLFHEQWIPMAQRNVLGFLKKFYSSSDLPYLCQLYVSKYTNNNSGNGLSNDIIASQREEDLKDTFKKREKKLMQFSRSMFDLSRELIDTLDAGTIVDQSFITNFKNKFSAFQEVFAPDLLSSPRQSGNDTTSPRNMNIQSNMMNMNRGGPGAAMGTPINSPRHGQDYDMLGKKPGYEASITTGSLNYEMIAHDLSHIATITVSMLLSNADIDLDEDQIDLRCADMIRGCSLLVALRREFNTSKDQQKMVSMQMARSDVLSFGAQTSAAPDSASNRLGAVGGGPLASFISTFGKVHANRSVQFSSSKLYEHCYLFAEFLCRFITCLSLTEHGESYIAPHGVLLTSAVCDALLAYRDDSMNQRSRQKGLPHTWVWCLACLVSLCSKTKQNQITLVRRGCTAWLANAFMGNQLNGDDMMLCTYLIGVTFNNIEAQRALVASNSMQRQTETLLTALMELLISNISQNNTEELKINLSRALSIFVEEPTIREVARNLEFAKRLLKTAEIVPAKASDAIQELTHHIASTNQAHTLPEREAEKMFNEVVEYLTERCMECSDREASHLKSHRDMARNYNNSNNNNNNNNNVSNMKNNSSSMNDWNNNSPDGTGAESLFREEERSRPRLPRTPPGGGSGSIRYNEHGTDMMSLKGQGHEGQQIQSNGQDQSDGEEKPPLFAPEERDEDQNYEENDDNLGRDNIDSGRDNQVDEEDEDDAEERD